MWATLLTLTRWITLLSLFTTAACSSELLDAQATRESAARTATRAAANLATAQATQAGLVQAAHATAAPTLFALDIMDEGAEDQAFILMGSGLFVIAGFSVILAVFVVVYMNYRKRVTRRLLDAISPVITDRNNPNQRYP